MSPTAASLPDQTATSGKETFLPGQCLPPCPSFCLLYPHALTLLCLMTTVKWLSLKYLHDCFKKERWNHNNAASVKCNLTLLYTGFKDFGWIMLQKFPCNCNAALGTYLMLRAGVVHSYIRCQLRSEWPVLLLHFPDCSAWSDQ